MKLLFVVPRYGEDAVGGAERLARSLATRGIGPDDHVEVATTCAVDHHSWANALSPGTTTEDDIPVHRFLVGDRDIMRFAALHGRLIAGETLSYADELEFMANSVWSPDLQEFLAREGERFDLLFFVPYLFGTTYWGMQVWPERSALIPCLHDEAYAHMQVIRKMITSSVGCLFNTAAEQRLANRLVGEVRGGVVGLGFDPPTEAADPGFAERHGLGRYVVFVGRLEEGKGVATAAEHVAEYARRHDPGLRLVLVGTGPYTPSRRVAKYVHSAGWLSESEKRSAIADAIALVNPSRMESYSIVLMEAWLEGVPVLVSGESDVLREHVEAAGGGFAFSGYEAFERALHEIATDPERRRALGRAGREYVAREANWAITSRRFRDVAGGLLSYTTAGR